MEGCSGNIGGNNNGCHDDGGQGDGGSEGCEDQRQQQRRHNDMPTRRCPARDIDIHIDNDDEEDKGGGRML